MYAKRGYHGQLYGFLTIGKLTEDRNLIAQPLIVVLVYLEFVHGKLDFTDVDNLITPLNKDDFQYLFYLFAILLRRFRLY